MNSKSKVLVFKPADNVGTAADDMPSGEAFMLEGDPPRRITVSEAIPFGFKIALEDILAGEEVIKYGEIIGRAIRLIRAGELVHVHNIEGTRGRGDLAPNSEGKA